MRDVSSGCAVRWPAAVGRRLPSRGRPKPTLSNWIALVRTEIPASRAEYTSSIHALSVVMVLIAIERGRICENVESSREEPSNASSEVVAVPAFTRCITVTNM